MSLSECGMPMKYCGDRRRRVRHFLFSIDPRAPLESLLEGAGSEAKFAGPEPWLAVLKGKMTSTEEEVKAERAGQGCCAILRVGWTVC